MSSLLLCSKQSILGLDLYTAAAAITNGQHDYAVYIYNA